MLDHGSLFLLIRGFSPFDLHVMSPTFLCRVNSCFSREQHLVRSFPGWFKFVFLPGLYQDMVTRPKEMHQKSKGWVLTQPWSLHGVTWSPMCLPGPLPCVVDGLPTRSPLSTQGVADFPSLEATISRQWDASPGVGTNVLSTPPGDMDPRRAPKLSEMSSAGAARSENGLARQSLLLQKDAQPSVTGEHTEWEARSV